MQKSRFGWLGLFVAVILLSCSSSTEPYQLAPIVTFDTEVIPYATQQGEPELFLSGSASKITLYDESRRIVWQGDIAGEFSILGSGPLDKSGLQAIFFAVNRGEGSFLGVLRYSKGLHGWMGDIKLEYWQVAESGKINRVRTADLDGDGRFEVLVTVNEYYRAYPRGVYVFDSKTGKVRWKYLCAPYVSSIEVEDINSDARPEIILGLYGINNQAVVAGRSDSTGGVVVLSAEGEELLYHEMGGQWARGVPKVALLNGEKALVVSEESYLGSNVDPDSLYVFDGVTLNQQRIIKTGEHFLGMDVIDVDHDGREEIITGNTDGVIRVFDGDLNEVARQEMLGSVQVMETMDMDGDGRKEIIAYAESGELIVFNERLERLASLEVKMHEPSERFRVQPIKSARQKKGRLLIVSDVVYKLAQKSPIKGGPLKPWMWIIVGLLATGLLIGLGWALYKTGVRSVGGLYEKIARMQAKYEDEKKVLEAELYRLKNVELERLVEERTAEVVRSAKLASIGVFASGIAHQVNNPLHIVLLNSGVLRRLLTSEIESMEEFRKQGLELIEALEAEVHRTRKVVKGLLAFTREAELNVRPTDVNSVVKDALDISSQHLPQANFDVQSWVEKKLPPAAVDANSVLQVILNVIQNAYDACGGQGKVTVETSAGTEEMIQISISNDGPPIPENLRDKIFEPLFTTKSVGKGTGLGLSVCAMLLDRFGGRIYLDESSNEQTTFVIEVPTALEEEK
jgi:signal transduction histidine kinase